MIVNCKKIKGDRSRERLVYQHAEEVCTVGLDGSKTCQKKNDPLAEKVHCDADCFLANLEATADSPTFQQTGEKIVITDSGQYTQEIRILEARALELARSDTPFTVRFNVYVNESEDGPKSFKSDAASLTEMTPISKDDLKARGYEAEIITQHVPKEVWEGLRPRMGKDEFDLSLFRDAIKRADLRISTGTSVRESSQFSSKDGESGASKVDYYAHTSSQIIASGFSATEKEDGSYDITLTIYKQPEA
jgi:hypothetical protein